MTKLSAQKGIAVIPIVIILALVGIGVIVSQNILGPKIASPNLTNVNPSPTSSSVFIKISQRLDLTKLPLGDGKYSNSPKLGYIYTCQTQFNGGGAFQAGPWINQQNKTWDLTKKVTVSGDVNWPNAKWTISSDGNTRSLAGNGLPINHHTGIYPISQTDKAYQYDRNPNSIKEQSLNLSLPTNPTVLTTPECIMGEVGIMLSGIPLFDGFDAGGRDAVAMEVQDDCSGHPQQSGQYHYHGYSKCLVDKSASNQHSDLMGYALDGFGIFGLKGEGGGELTSQDLDECHGHTHQILWDGKMVNMYHYHLTLDFPYSVSCFKGKKAVNGPLDGGQGGAAGTQGRRPPPPNGQSPQGPPRNQSF